MGRLGRLGLRPRDPFHSATIGEVYLMLTMDCNLRCQACSLWGTGGACHSETYYEGISAPAPLERFRAFIDELAELKPEYVNFAGGEPLMSRHWKELAARAKERGLRTILTTNGVFLDKFAEDVAESFDQVNISIACPPAMSKELRGGPAGHYQVMMRGLKRLAALRDRGGGKPVLRLMCEVFDSNGGHLISLIDHLADEGVAFDEIYFMHLIFNRPSVLAAQKRVFREEFGLPVGLWSGYGYLPHAMDYEALDAALARLRDSLPHARFNIDLRGAKALRDYYEGRRKGLGASFCDGPWRQVNVFPNGEVWVCPDYVLGDLKTGSFADIWDGPKARALRRRVFSNIFPSCRGCFSFYEKEQPVGPA
ncbi:MAG: radical SAM protein [Elusimicrobia bacterium]|nr:radical SAM protein [Elusimicrobiota bacterium]